MKRLAIILVLIVLILSNLKMLYADENRWSTGGPSEARVSTIAIHPFNDSLILLGTLEYGLYGSTDRGANWNLMEVDSIHSAVRYLAYHPAAPDTVYAATGHGFDKSSDGGESWQDISPPGYESVDMRHIEIHPVYQSTIFGCNYGASAFKSTDGGSSWSRLDLPFVAVMCIKVDHLHPDTVYLVTQSSDYRMSVFRSEDLGETWQSIHNDLDTNLWGWDLAIDETDSKNMYFSGNAYFDLTPTCLEKTTDGGSHWFDITPPGLLSPFVISVTISPFDHKTVYACTDGNGVLKSTDGGETWAEINEGITGRTVKKVIVDTLSGCLYLATYYSGIYRSTDSGQSWQKISHNINNASCLSLAVHPNEPDIIYVTTYSGALYRTFNNGLAWQQVNFSLPYQNVALSALTFNPARPANIFLTYYRKNGPGQGGIIRSIDNGVSWTELTGGLPINKGFYSIAITPHNDTSRLFLTSRAGLFVSDSYGETWTRIDGGIPGAAQFLRVKASQANPDLIFASDFSGNLFRSTDCGDYWTNVPSPPGDGAIADFVCAPSNPSIVYLARYSSGIYKSEDTGITWALINNNLPSDPRFVSVSGIAVNPLNSNIVFVNSHPYGVFISENGGQSWTPLNEGLKTLYFNSFMYIPNHDTNRLVLGTDLQSVWTITMTSAIVDDNNPLPIAYQLYPNYPNPFNSSTVLRYNLPAPSAVTLDIYDILGRKVTTLADGIRPAGSHQVTWNAEDIPSGVYFYKLQAGEYSETKKMILVK